MTKETKAKELLDAASMEWENPVGSIKIDKVSTTPMALWVTLKETGFPVDPDGYYFVNPPTTHDGKHDPKKAFEVIVADAARYYAERNSGQTTTTVFTTAANDGRIASGPDTTYSISRAGIGLSVATTSNPDYIGQQLSGGNYNIYEHFYDFDTSGVPDSDTVSDATLSIWCVTDLSVTDFVIEARLFDYSTTITNADYVPGASWTGNTLLASANTSGLPAGDTAYYALTSQAAFASNVNKTGSTRMVLCSDRFGAGTAPVGNELIYCILAEEAGTTKDPKLVVTHAGGVAADVMDPMGMRGFFGA